MVQNQQQNQPQPQVESAEAEEKPKGGVESPVMAVTEEERLRMHLQQQQISAQMQQQPMNINTSFNIGAFAGALPARASGGSQQQPGTIKVGFYEVDRTIGKGNYAVVKLARHRITKTEVAIKIVDKRRLDANNLAKIYREIEVLKKLRHPHIVRLYQVMETSNMLYLVTEYAPNGEIFDLISKQHRLTEENAREKFWQIISAVDYLHNMNIVHRDLKAENLLLDANFQIKLADFGFSNFFSAHDTLNTFCGSPPYAAPEVFEGKRYEGPEIDIWSLGVILYVMVCGALPFEGMNLQLLRDRVLSGRIRIPYFMSSDCEHLIRKMLTVDPRRRPTIDQIKQHRWMRFGQYAAKYGQQSQQQQQQQTTAMANQQQQQQQEQNGQQPPPEPHPQILRLMNNIGIESHKVRTALQMDAYDNFQAIYLLLLERLQQRGSPSLSPSQSSSAANTAPGSGGQSSAVGIATAASASSLPASPPILLQQQNVVATAAAIMQPKLQQQQPSSPQSVVANMVINSPTSPKAPALVLTASPINPIISPEANRLIRGVKARRQSDGVAVLGGGMAPCQCCCCTAALQQPIGRRLPLQPTTAQLVSRQAALAFAHQMQQQQAVAEAAGEGQQPMGHQHPIGHHPSTSDYESENCCSGSSAAGSTLSRQSTIGTINSFDEGIPDDAATGSGLLMFAAAAAHCSFHGGGGGGTFFHEQLPAFDSQLSQDPLFSSQSSNNSAAAFRMGSSSSNGPPGSEDLPSCCCSASSTGVSAGGTGGNLVRHVQLHPHCPGGIGQGHHQHPGHLHHHHHGHTHQHLLKPYWFPAVVARQPQQIQSARDASTGEGGSEHQQQSSSGEAENASSSAHHGLFGVQQQWRASDNSIGDSLTFPTGQLGKRNRAMHELHRPQQQQQQQATGIAQPLLHNQLRRMRISTGLATLAKTVPLALGVTASPILSAGICGNMVGAQQHQQQQQQQQLSSPSSCSSASSAASPLDKRPPAPASASAVRQVLGCLPKRISLPENLEFQPQMLLNLKQSIHVEKQLTSNPDAVSADPSSGGCSELSGFDKPMLMKTSRLQHYQQQQQQKRKAARLQLLRQQSYHIAQKQSVISSSLPMNLNSSSHSCGGSPTALNFHPKALLQLQTSASPTTVQKMFDDHAMEDGEDAASENNNNTGGGSSSGNPKNNRIPLSPIEDLKAEEVMDTT